VNLKTLMERVWESDELADLDPAARRLALRDVVTSEPGADITWVGRLADAIDGFGPLTDLMLDDGVTDILVNGPHEVWAERGGELKRAKVRFEDDEELFSLIERLAGDGGIQVDPSRPVGDVRLPDGSRMHVVLPPVAPLGPLVSIRRFPRAPLGLDDLLNAEMMSADEHELLTKLVSSRSTILISGKTGSGKTTLLNALLGLVPMSERVVLVEETPELRPASGHHVSLVARPANPEGLGEVTLADLVRNALRMRPDRIVVGEVRGAEASVALHAMATGHAGSLLTLHAGTPSEALERLALLATSDHLAEASARRWVTRSIDAVVQLERCHGRRVVAEVVQV
jgi:pilus assembly protein CpaF